MPWSRPGLTRTSAGCSPSRCVSPAVTVQPRGMGVPRAAGTSAARRRRSGRPAPPSSAHQAGTSSATGSLGAASASPPSGSAAPWASPGGCVDRPASESWTRSAGPTSARSTRRSTLPGPCCWSPRTRSTKAVPADSGARCLRCGSARSWPTRWRPTIRVADHALGPGPLAFEAEHATRVSDLRVYVRQHHAERDSAALGRARSPPCGRTSRGEAVHPRQSGNHRPSAWAERPEWEHVLPAELDGFDRVVVVAAHPDDETLGAGGLIATAAAADLDVHLFVCTAGEHSHPSSPTHRPEDLAMRRKDEVREALGALAPGAGITLAQRPGRASRRARTDAGRPSRPPAQGRPPDPHRRPVAPRRAPRPRRGRSRGGDRCRTAPARRCGSTRSGGGTGRSPTRHRGATCGS